MFDKTKAQQHLDKFLLKYGITVIKWSSRSCGVAWPKRKEIKIPRPTNTDKFCVAMHEVKHIIDGLSGKRFEQEFDCDMFAREQALLLGFDVTEWDKRTNWHVLSRIAMAFNRGLKADKVKPRIRNWFKNIDFDKWENKKIFVSYMDNDLGCAITMCDNLSRVEIEEKFKPMGLILEKSEYDDSSYNKWLVLREDNRLRVGQYDSLAEVIINYKFTKDFVEEPVKKKKPTTITELRTGYTYLRNLYEQVVEHGSITIKKDSFYMEPIKKLFEHEN